MKYLASMRFVSICFVAVGCEQRTNHHIPEPNQQKCEPIKSDVFIWFFLINMPAHIKT